MIRHALASRLGAALEWPVRRPNLTLVIAAAVLLTSIALVTRLRPAASLEALMARNNPAASALARVVTEFRSVDDLLLVASVPELHPETNARMKLLEFAQRLENSIMGNPNLHGRVERISFRADPSSPERRFIEQVVVPAAVFYLDDRQVEELKSRLGLDSMREQIRRNEELMAAPGPAAEHLAKLLVKDPLRLRDFLATRSKEPFALSALASGEGFFSKDGRSLLIRISGTRPVSDLDFARVFLADIQHAAQQVNADGLTLECTGSYAIAAASELAIRRDMIQSVISSVVLMQVLFLLTYRRPFSFVLAFLPTGVAILAALGLSLFFSSGLTPATAAIGAVLAGLGIDYSIHFLSHYERRCNAGQAAVDAALVSGHELAAPMAASAATTLVAFAAIAMSDVPALRDFAIIGGIGLALAALGSLTVLPAILVLTDRWFPQRRKPGVARIDFDALIRTASARAPQWTALMIVFWLAALVAIAVSGRAIVPTEADLRVMHPRPNPALDLEERLAARFGLASDTLLIHLRADSPDDLTAFSHRVDMALRDPKARQAGVQSTFGLSSLLPDPTRTDHVERAFADFDVESVIVNFEAAVGESLFDPARYAEFPTFLRRVLTPSSPPTITALLDYPELASMILPRSAIEHRTEPREAVQLVMLDRSLNDRAAQRQAFDEIRGLLNDAAPPGAQATLTGLSVIGYDTELSIRGELRRVLLIAALMTLLIIVAFFRRFGDAALTLLPLGFGLTCLLAMLHVTGDGLNPVNLIGVPLLVGTGIDYGIHVMSIARRHRRSRAPAAMLASKLGASVHALMLSGLTTMLGFGSLAFTSTPAIRSLARLAAVGIAACLAATLFLLVPILITMSRRMEPRMNTNERG